MNKIRLGDLLIEKKIITEIELKEALKEQKINYDKLGNILIKLELVSETEVLTMLSEQLDIPYIDIYGENIDYKIIKNYNKQIFNNEIAIPFKETEEEVYVSISDPLNYDGIELIETELGFKELKLFISSKEDLLQILNRYNVFEDTKSIIDDVKFEINSNLNDDDGQIIDEESAIMNLINQIVKNGILHGASDIHIEPSEHNMNVRIRIDGFLREIYSFDLDIYRVLNTRIKLLGNLNISEKFLPQDGRFSLKIDNKKFDFRLSTLPTDYGESIVIRILDSDKVLLKLNQLGITDENFETFNRLTKSSHGILLITGPTGSGKTTTLYSVLNEVKSIENKIITIEDPIEYKLPLIVQTQTNEKKELDFKKILKSILRQDPDIIMLGEVRDVDTLTVMAQASMTGHLVLSTIHTNSAVGAITRMTQMGLPSFLIADSLIGSTAQRLVRKNCNFCIKEYRPSSKLLKQYKNRIPEGMIFYKGEGCPKCENTGYISRLMVVEVLEINEDIKDMIIKKESSAHIIKYAKEKFGFKDMFDDGLKKCKEKLTTLEEVVRVAS